MACHGTPISHFPRNATGGTPQPYSIPFQYRPNIDTLQSQYNPSPDTIGPITALHSRIAVLETQLDRAKVDRIAAENAARFVLHVAVEQSAKLLRNGSVDENISHFKSQLLKANEEKSALKVKLQKAIRLWGHAFRHAKAQEKNMHASASTCRSCSRGGPEETCHKSEKSVTTLVDLIDMDPSTDDTPELDYSDGSSVSEDDLDECIQGLPKIDIGLRKSTSKQAKEGALLSAKATDDEPVHLRRFLGDVEKSLNNIMQEPMSWPSKSSSDKNPTSKASRLFCSEDEIHTTGEPQSTTRAKSRTAFSTVPNSLAMSRYAYIDKAENVPSISSAMFSIAPVKSHNPLNLPDSLADEQATLTEEAIIPELAQDWNNAISASTVKLEERLILATCSAEKLFSSKEEREIAICMNKNAVGPEDVRIPDMLRFGICYEPTSDETKIYRTLSIMNLPPTLSVSDLLSKIRGGALVSVELLDTVSITGSFSALVTFLYQRSAVAFEAFTSENPVYFGTQKAHVKLLTTPTWPLRVPLWAAIFDHGHTRCLEVRNFPRHIAPAALRHDLRSWADMTTDRVESMHMRKDGVLELRFSSIEAAGKASGILNSYRAYQQCCVSFVKDPCSLPLETLLKSDEVGVENGGPESSTYGEPGEALPTISAPVVEQPESLTPQVETTSTLEDIINKNPKALDLNDGDFHPIPHIDEENARVLAKMAEAIVRQPTTLLDISVH